MRCAVYFVFVFLYFIRLVVTTPLLQNQIRQQYRNAENINLNNAKLPTPMQNPLYNIPGNNKYPPQLQNYERLTEYNGSKFYNTFRPFKLPLSPYMPTNYRSPYVQPTLYNTLNPYNTPKYIRPVNYLQTDAHKPIYLPKRSEESPVLYPAESVKYEQKRTDTSDATLDVQNILSKLMVQDHYKSSQKKYMIIHPDGTVEDVDSMESIVAENPNYVLVNGVDILMDNDSVNKQYEQESLASSNIKPTQELKPNPLAPYNEAPTSEVLMKEEKLIDKPVFIEDDSRIEVPNTGSDDLGRTDLPIKNIPTTLIEIYPPSTTLLDNEKPQLEIQLQEEAIIASLLELSEDCMQENVPTTSSMMSSEELPSLFINSGSGISFNPFIDFEDVVTLDSSEEINQSNVKNPLDGNLSDDTIANPITGTVTSSIDASATSFVSSQINETKTNGSKSERNAEEDSNLSAPQSSIMNENSDIGIIPTLSNTKSNMSDYYSEQDHLVNEMQLPLEPDIASNIDDLLSPVIEVVHNETSDQFREINDTYIEKDVNELVNNSTDSTQDNLNIMPLVEDKTDDLAMDSKIDESQATMYVPEIEISDNVTDYSKIEPDSDIDSPTLSTMLKTDITDPISAEKEIVYFKIDKDFWEKLKNKEIPFDIVYFFQVQDEPVIEKDIRTIVFPNGTVVTMETVRKINEDNQPIVIENIDSMDP